MKCRVCGASLRSVTTDMPWKVSDRTIVVIKRLPVMQCEGCIEYLIEDAVMARVDELLSRVDRSTEFAIRAVRHLTKVSLIEQRMSWSMIANPRTPTGDKVCASGFS